MADFLGARNPGPPPQPVVRDPSILDPVEAAARRRQFRMAREQRGIDSLVVPLNSGSSASQTNTGIRVAPPV